MIQLIEKKTQWRGPICEACVEGEGITDAYMCDVCVGRIMTIYKCPHCNVIRNYFAKQAPDSCPTCKSTFPDFNDLLRSKHARIDYYLDKEIY
jgi:hypothetical protein